MSVSVRLNERSYIADLLSPTGPVARDLQRRGERVVARARQLAPKRTGRLAASIRARQISTASGPTVVIEATEPYADEVHDGTGVFGPARRPIVARPGRVFVFDGRAGKTVFTTRIRGARGRRFLVDALPAAAG